MKVLVKYTPAMPKVLAPMHNNSGRHAVFRTSTTGACSVWPGTLRACSALALSSRNSGDSLTPRRIIKPTINSSELARNGSRHPQLIRSASGSRVTALNASNDRIRPAGLPNWANEAKKFRRPWEHARRPSALLRPTRRPRRYPDDPQQDQQYRRRNADLCVGR